MQPQPEQDGVASAAPPEDAPWRQRKRSASSSPLPPPQPPSSSLQQIRCLPPAHLLGTTLMHLPLASPAGIICPAPSWLAACPQAYSLLYVLR